MSINSTVRQIRGKVELYQGSTLKNTFTYADRLISFTIERNGDECKFFGYGVPQKINIKLQDRRRELSITTDYYFKVYLTDASTYTKVGANFYVTEVHRDENTNELSITAYDLLYWGKDKTVSELGLTSYTIKEFATAVSGALGCSGVTATNTEFNLSYTEGANFEGTETLREALDDIAEATQTIYYIDANNKLVFKRLSMSNSKLTLTKAKYFTSSSKTNRKLVEIVSATELGDNVSASLGVSGTTQYVRDNAFWSLREDIGTLVENALTAIGGLTINQFTCDWRGDYTAQIGDLIELTTKDNEVVTSFLINDILEYNGALSESTSWEYQGDDSESASNPSTLGEALKQTYARVDKANKTISLVVSDVENNTEEISSLVMNQDSINITVNEMKEEIISTVDGIQGEIQQIVNQVSANVTSEDLTIEVSRQISEGGVKSVETTTGFVFNEEGLTVSKTDSEMSTQITEDGMTVSNGNDVTLTANNQGVDAINLHATTYLIIGNNSRFEDYGNGRTGCFMLI